MGTPHPTQESQNSRALKPLTIPLGVHSGYLESRRHRAEQEHRGPSLLPFPVPAGGQDWGVSQQGVSGVVP